MNASCVSIHPRFPIKKYTPFQTVTSNVSILSIISPTFFQFYTCLPFYFYLHLSVNRVIFVNLSYLNPCLNISNWPKLSCFCHLATPTKHHLFPQRLHFLLCFVFLKHLSFLILSHLTSSPCFSRVTHKKKIIRICVINMDYGVLKF
jgi:hypothetical protein